MVNDGRESTACARTHARTGAVRQRTERRQPICKHAQWGEGGARGGGMGEWGTALPTRARGGRQQTVHGAPICGVDGGLRYSSIA